MTYTLTSTSSVVRDADGAFIPSDPRNTDWLIYQAWLAEPNTPNPIPVPAVVVSQVVTVRQFYQAAAMLGIITEVEALAFINAKTKPAALNLAVATLPAAERFAANMSIAGATSYCRGDSFVVALGAAMGISEAQIDSLFVLAASL